MPCLRRFVLLLLIALSPILSYCQTPSLRKTGEKAFSIRVPTNGILSLPIEQVTGRIAVTNNTVIHITGKFDNAQGVKELSLRVYGTKHAATRENGNFDLVLDASKLEKGENLVKVQIEQGKGVGQVAAQAVFFIYSKPPVQLVVPTENKDFAKSVPLTVVGEAGFKPQSATFYKGGVRLPNKSSAINAEWEAMKEAEKDYLLWAEVVSETGEKYQTAAVRVTVPRRVSVSVPSEPIEITGKTKSTKITLDYLAGVKPKSVDLFLDGTSAGSIVKAPFNDFVLDLAEIPSGIHRISVKFEDENGAKYESTEASLVVKNKAYDKQREEEQKLIQSQTEEEERLHKEWDKNLLLSLRRRVVGRIPTMFRRGAGTIGRVNGLSVLVKTLSINGRIVDQREYGKSLIVECFMRQGSGRISLLASASSDTQDSVKTAASLMKRLVDKKGLTPNWTMIDVIIGYSDVAQKIGGDSAGIANTTAMLSVALNLQADDSVAMTGAIDSDGSVQPVGGILWKGSAAFSNPQIKTLILPDNSSNAEELSLLYRLRPELFANKRIILAQNIEQVLRQSLIGYDEQKLKYAEGKFISAVNSFIKGEDDVALNDLKVAQKVTPENFTLQIWIAMIEEAKAMRPKH